MADVTDNDLLDYEEEDTTEVATEAAIGTNGTAKKEVKGTYVSIHSSGFRPQGYIVELQQEELPMQGLISSNMVWLSQTYILGNRAFDHEWS